MLSRIVGRTADYLMRSDGSKVSGISLVEKTLTAIEGIEQLQIIQDQLQNFVLNVVPDENYVPSAGEELVGVIKDVFGDSAEVLVKIVEKLSQSDNGKYRFAISNVQESGIGSVANMGE